MNPKVGQSCRRGGGNNKGIRQQVRGITLRNSSPKQSFADGRKGRRYRPAQTGGLGKQAGRTSTRQGKRGCPTATWQGRRGCLTSTGKACEAA